MSNKKIIHSKYLLGLCDLIVLVSLSSQDYAGLYKVPKSDNHKALLISVILRHDILV